MNSSFWRILPYAKSYKAYFAGSFVFNLLATVFSLASIGLVIPVLRIIFGQVDSASVVKPEYTGDLLAYVEGLLQYGMAQQMAENGQQQALLFVCYWVIGAFFLKNLFRYLGNYAIAPLRNGVTRDIRKVLHHKVMNLPVSYFTEQRKGDVMARMTNDLMEVERSLLALIEVLFKDPFLIVGSLVVLFWMSPQLTLFVLILLPIVSFLISRIGKSLKKSSRGAQAKLGDILSLTEEHLTGLKVIQAFNAEKQKQTKFNASVQSYFRFMNRVLRKSDLASPLSEFLGSVVMALVIWYGGSLVLEGGAFTAESFIAYILFFYQLIPPSKNLSKAGYKIQQGSAAADRVFELLDAENPVVEISSPKSISEFKSSLKFDHVSFAYGDKPVLNDLNFEIEKGKTYALVGPSGGGKTTITGLVPRFFDPQSGMVSMDGINLRDLSICDLRKQVGLVTQETLLFNESVAYNIALGNEGASLDAIEAAAKVANAHDFIADLEKGYQTKIGDGGSKLSGGQRQRLSIARAVLKNPPIMVLDEATSALDTESEQLVQEALYKLMENRTSLVIAHRLSTIQHADEILVIDKGRIVERGTHAELLDLGGLYRRLVEMQSFS